jgi:AraC family transcriptional activator of pobA
MPPATLSIHAEPIRTGLQPRSLGGLVDLRAPSFRAALVVEGALRLEYGGEPEEAEGPVLVWLPQRAGDRLAALPGSVGAHLALDDTALANAIGAKPEAADLRLLASGVCKLPLADAPGLLADLSAAFDMILSEAAAQRPGSLTIVEAQVRVILVLLWRHAAQPQDVRAAQGAAGLILQRFRQLLETHFRDRWTVARYAGELGITADRLHDICVRSLGTPPLRLIHARLAHEAEALLARSSLSVDQIAAFLGFRSAAQFSRFFKRMAGLPPAAFRASARRSPRDAAPSARSYAEWP